MQNDFSCKGKLYGLKSLIICLCWKPDRNWLDLAYYRILIYGKVKADSMTGFTSISYLHRVSSFEKENIY